MNLILIATFFICVVFLAPACAAELNHDSNISMDDSVIVDDSIPSDIPIDGGSAVDDVIPSDIPSDNNGSDNGELPFNDNGSDDANNLPIDDVVPSDVPSDDNGSESDRPINEDISSDDSVPADDAIPSDVPISGIIDNNSALIDNNSNVYKNTDSMDCSDGNNDDTANYSKLQSYDLYDWSYALDDSFNKLPFDKVKDYQKILFNNYYVRISLIESEDIFKHLKNNSVFDVKRTIDLIESDSSVGHMNKGNHGLSLDVSTLNTDDDLSRVNLNDSIFAGLSIADSMGNKTLVKDLTPENCPNLFYFSSDKTFKKVLKTNFFKVRDIWFLLNVTFAE